MAKCLNLKNGGLHKQRECLLEFVIKIIRKMHNECTILNEAELFLGNSQTIGKQANERHIIQCHNEDWYLGKWLAFQYISGFSPIRRELSQFIACEAAEIPMQLASNQRIESTRSHPSPIRPEVIQSRFVSVHFATKSTTMTVRSFTFKHRIIYFNSIYTFKRRNETGTTLQRSEYDFYYVQEIVA